MRVLIATIGSSGDIHPYIAVGRALAARGHAVMMLANPHFAARVKQAELGFAPLGTEDDYLRVLMNEELVHPWRGPSFVIRELITGTLRPLIEETGRLIREFKPDVVLRHHIAFGARWACEKAGVPCAVGVLSPLFWFSLNDRAVYRQVLIQDAPPWLQRVRRFIGRRTMRTLVDKPLNPLRRENGLEPEEDLFVKECRRGIVNLGLWSRHFRPPMQDDPDHGRICGFASFDRAPDAEHEFAEIESFLSDCEREGQKPVVVTLGTSVVHHGRELYEFAGEACRRLGRRGLLLTGKAEYAPGNLPPGVRAFTYAPYSLVLPRAAAIVHHGGVGTTAAAMRAGVPTVIVPFANDEFDNAARARRLGVSRTVRESRLTLRRLEDALARLLADSAATARAADLGSRLAAEAGADTAAVELQTAVEK